MVENDKSTEVSSTQSPTSLEQLTTNELELKTSEEQPLSCEESSKDVNDYKLETVTSNNVIQKEASVENLQLKVTSSNVDLSNVDVTIMPVEKTDDNQLEPPSKKIRSEEPTEELEVALLEHLKNPTSCSIIVHGSIYKQT
ncbi:hypothetical protein CBL_08193 [Carabus blaptoides fortunei]